MRYLQLLVKSNTIVLVSYTYFANVIAGVASFLQTLLGTDNCTKGKKVETTIHHAKEPQLSVRVSMIESLNEEIENCPV